jgi:site-specific DNA-methyltransferase (adenine-specific)
VKDLVRQAFLAVHKGFSTDRVVADPEMNRRFLEECRRLGSEEPASLLNQRLLNLRKASDLKGLPRSRRTSFADEEQYRFASEVAARYLERAKGLNVDQILCDPDLAQEFDCIAADLAPGYRPLQYRWAALNLRKSKRLEPELLARVAPSAKCVSLGRVESIKADQLPRGQGLYVFCDAESKQVLYVGEASNLRKRLEKHLDHSDNKSLARWLWDHGAENLFLEIHSLPDGTSTLARRALEAELIRSRRATFNIQRQQ